MKTKKCIKARLYKQCQPMNQKTMIKRKYRIMIKYQNKLIKIMMKMNSKLMKIMKEMRINIKLKTKSYLILNKIKINQVVNYIVLDKIFNKNKLKLIIPNMNKTNYKYKMIINLLTYQTIKL